MSSLKKTLSKKGYHRIPFKITKTNHLVLKGKLNGSKGRFILDTGASNSCIGFDSVTYFKVETTDSDTKASGAGATNMETLKSTNNKLKLDVWKTAKLDLVVFNLSHVNQALEEHGAKQIHGIIGADVLMKGEAIIDYKKKLLYLK
ncbi:retropepsin-like aspartic protease [Flavicella sediminum]|uniref:retropepsin-like aspartic protease n=1 Tax=Flavicella sediminum TaxID=2585141 RepID=UPI0011227C50|nr:retropepsin-like aspartic protease [Flavicella sediminum]